MPDEFLPWSCFLRRFRSDLTRSLSKSKERVGSDIKRLKNQLREHRGRLSQFAGKSYKFERILSCGSVWPVHDLAVHDL